MPEIVEGIISRWVKPVKPAVRYPSLGDALVGMLHVPDVDQFFNPRPENDPFFPFVASQAKAFFSFKPGRVLISADYDVDGATSSVILGRAFRALGFEVRAFVPDRFHDNYGINYGRMDEIYAEWPFEHFVATDCGATELVGLSEFGRKMGVTIAVVDHHKRGPVPDDGVFEVNPHMRLADGVKESGYSAAIIAAMLVRSSVADFPAFSEILEGCEILAGLSAMADSASMLEQGARYYAKTFLSGALTPASGVGIAALLNIVGIKTQPTSTDVSFKVIPLINAAGRLRTADIILALLQESDPNKANDIVEKLQVLNKTRRTLQDEVQKMALAEYHEGDSVLIACNRAWHSGVVGPAAGQLAELLGIPVFLGGYIPAKKSYSFSGRTGSDVDIHALLSKTSDGLPLQFGGHKVALGIKVNEDDIGCIDELRTRLLAAAPVKSKFTRSITKVLLAKSVSIPNCHELGRLEPFGVDNPIPVFCIPRVKLTLQPLTGISNSCSGTAVDEDGTILSVLIFRNVKLAGTRKFYGHIVGEMLESFYGSGSELKFIIKDLIPIT